MRWYDEDCGGGDEEEGDSVFSFFEEDGGSSQLYSSLYLSLYLEWPFPILFTNKTYVIFVIYYVKP